MWGKEAEYCYSPHFQDPFLQEYTFQFAQALDPKPAKCGHTGMKIHGLWRARGVREQGEVDSEATLGTPKPPKP